MSTKREEINKLVDDLIVEKTFSLEIVEKIKKMRDDFLAMEEKEKQTSERNSELTTQNSKLVEENNRLKAHDEGVTNREKVVAEKEAKQALQDLKLEHAVDKHKEMKELLGIVFKNPVVRETAYKNTNVPVAQNGYVSNFAGSESEGKTVEKE